jgi:hypothetical protein
MSDVELVLYYVSAYLSKTADSAYVNRSAASNELTQSSAAVAVFDSTNRV